MLFKASVFSKDEFSSLQIEIWFDKCRLKTSMLSTEKKFTPSVSKLLFFMYLSTFNIKKQN